MEWSEMSISLSSSSMLQLMSIIVELAIVMVFHDVDIYFLNRPQHLTP